ncbi:B12-binding domain-containing radical SAM protein [Olleya sp. Bg11-27]|uniref:B12-binding domain-containing radical SAM protein n=1 Tax=Olleya sp. Bg11-27 TaxID=2058135 RepID=UPI000C2FF761|nr:B12-binding domain-containing radical SAM protein [Olleya sp. Bg11-27]AUC75640.1 radical SAM protein [Olleya sp. Bg11-27]
MKDLLLITPPFTQLNTPYPATAYLKGFLNTIGVSAFQMDLGIEVILELFSKKTFEKLFDLAIENDSISTENGQRIYTLKDDYLQPLDAIILFLQGKNQTLARQICTTKFLPQASRFEQLEDMDWAFGEMGMQDKAKHLATLYLEDLSDFIIECIDPNFGFSRYAERLGQSANAFDELYESLKNKPTFIDELTLAILENRLKTVQPKLICFSVPFPGNLYSAFRCAQFIKKNYPEIKIAIGGGFPNTELRQVTDTRVFDFFDFITLDDGELPIALLYQNVCQSNDNQSPSETDLENNLENDDQNSNNKGHAERSRSTTITTDHSSKEKQYKRTFLLEDGKVVYKNNTTRPEYKQLQVGTPDYSDLLLEDYISVIEIANPMHSLWSDGRWNKLTMAHGCYWGKCTFCDISLDYIKIYEPIAAALLVDRMEQLIAQTGENGFHFVDEAAPPALMKALALEIIKRKLTVTWWTNIRFEKNFTQDLCYLLKASGCIAVSGGLEVASDRLLKLIDKGVTVEQVAQVTRNFTQANIMVHSYLMYGYPTQTVQETVDSLEMVRQLFELGIIQSGFWHQFALTAHSPIGLNPTEYGITPNYKSISFANNDIDFTDSTGIDHSQFSFGLKKSLFNFMHGIGFDMDLQEWFDFEIPQTSIVPFHIEDCLNIETTLTTKPTAKIVWLGHLPLVAERTKTKKGFINELLDLTFHDKTERLQMTLNKPEGEWLLDTLETLKPTSGKSVSFSALKKDFETQLDDFELFWFSKPMQKLKDFGLLQL